MSKIWIDLLTAFSLAAAESDPDWRAARSPQMNPPATEQQVQVLEAAVGARLPTDYRDFLLTSNGLKNYLPGNDLPGTVELTAFVRRGKERNGTYARDLRKTFFYYGEMGLGVRDEDVLMISNFDGNPGAIFLVVNEKSPSYGKVVHYWPSGSTLSSSWTATVQEETGDWRKKARKRTP